MPHILVLCAHPDLRLSRVNHRLLEAAQALERDPPPGVTLETRDLYARYPDYVLDVAGEQAAVERADLIVWQHPIYWYSMPPLMKLWLDEVLAHGWAYGHSGHALRGKDLWLVASTGGSQEAYHPSGYNRYFFDAFLPPYEQTAMLCGLRFLPPMVLHGAHKVAKELLLEHVARFRDRLSTYPRWPELEELEQCPDCEVPDGDRPADVREVAEARAVVA